MDNRLAILDQVTATAIDLGVKFGPKVVVAIAILLAGMFAGRWTARAVGKALQRYRLEPPVRMLLERVARLLVFGLFLILALQNLGIELLPLIAGLGVAGAGIALAAQGVLSNIVAGLTIIFSRPFRVGEYISIVKEEGVVLDISLFSTTLGHADLSRVVIPNRKIVGEILHNYGTIRQVDLEVAVSYDADVGKALEAVRDVLQANARVLKDPAPAVGVLRLAEAVVIGVGPWVNAADYGEAGGEINRAILEDFRGRNIPIPTPVRLVSGAYLGGGRAERDAA